jgi:pyrroline-5-carboxylate reductase
MTRKTIGFIGGGNMARAIAGGLVRSGFGAANILIAEPLPEQRELLQQQFPGSFVTANNNDVAADAGGLVLAVKPQILGPVCRDLRNTVQNRKPLVISIAAGPTAGDIDNWLGGDLEIVRVMPNQPALIDQGISAMYANEKTDELGRILAERIMSAVGQVVWIDDESLLDAVTAVSGTGPAYVYLLLDIMIDAAIQLGIDPGTARTLVVQTARGAASLAMAESESLRSLIDRVRSPGGTTTAAFECLDAAGVRDIFATAITAARNRARSLAEEARDT